MIKRLLGYIFVGLLLAAPNLIVAYAATAKGIASFGQSISVLSTIDPEHWDDIMRCQSIEDMKDEIEAAFNSACTAFDSGARVTFPTGCYPIASPGVLLTPDTTHGCSGLQLIGSESTLRENNAPQFVALNDRVGTANRDALIFVKGSISSISIKGFIFNMADTQGDGLRMELCRFCNVSDNYFTGVKGAAYGIASSDSATERITITSQASQFVIGDRVEFSVDDDGGVLPGGISANTGYFIVAKPTATEVQVSATPGGAVVNLTTSVGNFFIMRGSVTYQAASVDAGTNTFAVTNHHLVNGDMVEWSTGALPLYDGLLLPSRRLWVVEAVADVSFRVSDSPGGVPIDITTAGGANQKLTPRAYAQVSGGGNLYPKYIGNRHVDDNARCLHWTISDTNPSGGAYYGTNAGRVAWNDFNCPVKLSGVSNVEDNAFEGPYGPPALGALEISDVFSNLDMTIDGNYYECASSGPHSYTAISVNGPALASGWVTFNRIFGCGSGHTNSGCFRAVSFPAGGHYIANKCRAAAFCFYNTTFGDYQLGSSSATSMIEGNSCPTAATMGLPALASVENGESTRPAALFQNPIQRYHYWTGGTVADSMSHTLSAPTSVDLGDSMMVHLVGAFNVSSFTNADREGSRYTFVAEAAGRMGTVLATPWGGPADFRNGEIFGVVINRNATEQLEYRMGQVATHVLPLTGQTGDIGSTAIFGVNITAGVYRVECYLRVTIAGTGGTIDLDLAWNDGTSRTESVIDDLSLASTGYADSSTIVETNGSSDISFSTTRAGVTGSPVYAVRCPVTMLQ